MGRIGWHSKNPGNLGVHLLAADLFQTVEMF
jgi:hypothetical protein